MIPQRTIKTPVQTTGVGLHTGARVTLVMRPADEHTGIVFQRTDLPTSRPFRIAPERVVDTRLCSALEADGVRIATVEHLMSALAGLGIDNLHIDIDGPEVPILDGSAAPFVYLLQSAGIRMLQAPKRFIRVRQALRVEEGDKWARFEPYEGYSLTFRIDFDHPLLRNTPTEITLDFGRQSYVQEVSRARTFGFTRDVEYLRSHGLALGGTLDNAIVLDDYRILNTEGLRYADEFVKHKVLDAVGDLYLTGHPILGAFTAYKSGHGLNNTLLRTLMATPEAWTWQEYPDARQAPKALLALYPPPA
ncbi:MAG TPA: UDP-3-O-acyl-N-acetylglucosamine deacetylase [Thiobacillaceae bacterium]|nr:UDP-3-O-acyl-N-acetylglucosamine deacetylase [Thiobacillaceae bacterium]HNU63721.1 UDP-3-O-acyl-N-acetylglucosamine deacetylase [Thiobacillaceae bacterium]